ncbi:hypothetical protein P171DRAFT_243121 [Karstenula rhodostoma CBS 690.94]|uniref:Uncharacterized protein n=1 Tax=Karstenula rhodostoma CBS 690.94 TaxID=1392251 RepID=A0A9P4PPR2_9PLEO|nr:hypothetical protein P171DRAFT_243121 [Karstenula rhodostoma CBS 690.94]
MARFLLAQRLIADSGSCRCGLRLGPRRPRLRGVASHARALQRRLDQCRLPAVEGGQCEGGMRASVNTTSSHLDRRGRHLALQEGQLKRGALPFRRLSARNIATRDTAARHPRTLGYPTSAADSHAPPFDTHTSDMSLITSKANSTGSSLDCTHP